MTSTSRSFAGLPSSRKRNFAVSRAYRSFGCCIGTSSMPVPAAGFTSVGVPTLTKVSTRRCVCSTSSFAAFAGIPVAISAARATPALRFAVFFPARHHRVFRHRDAIGAGLAQLEIEAAARAALRHVLRSHRLTIGPGHDERIDRHRALVDREQVVGHGRIHRDPAAGARQHGLRRQQPGPGRLADRGHEQREHSAIK